ncbi:hypothetical protein BH23CHL7_BH23CHL7_08080 [soil metagenome]
MPARRPPDIGALLDVLTKRQVDFVVTGSVAALMSGVELQAGDLDITPATDSSNLERLAFALEEIGAGPDPDGAFGDWTIASDGEWRWVQREARPGEREARVDWRPDPGDPASFDHLLETKFGALDVVPEISGTYADLASRAARISAFGQEVLVASIADQLVTLTVPRRDKDRERVRALRALQRPPDGVTSRRTKAT